MSEYFMHSVIKDFVNYWKQDASAEKYLQKLMHYQGRYIERNLITSQEHVQTVANRSPNPKQFLEKYDYLDSGKTDLLPKYLTLLSLLQNNKGLIEEFANKASEINVSNIKNISRIDNNVNQCQDTLTVVEDVESIFKRLNHVAKELKEKKNKHVNVTNKKENSVKQIVPDVTVWKHVRPFMSADYSNNSVIHNLLPIGAVPRSSQEKYLVKDVLQCLLGFNGKYIFGTRSEAKDATRIFTLEPSIYSPFKSVVLEILVLAEYYSTVMRFIEDQHQFVCGRVNQALCAVLEDFMQDYRIYIVQLEMKSRKELLSLQGLLFSIQIFLENMNYLARIVHAINKAEARGGRTLSLLHDAAKQNALEHKAAHLFVVLIRAASVPYFEALERWIHTGFVYDPCNEFMIEDNKGIENQKELNKGECPNEYWKIRYRIKKDQVPTFLHQYQQKILRTGKYLNTIKQCRNISSQDINSIFAKKSHCTKMCYTSLNSYEFGQSIETAYNFSSDTLLNLLMNEYDILNRLKSVKRYFLIEQGDFLSIMMDLCEEELSKPITEIVSTRLNSLIELAIRMCSSSKTDPYKNDIYVTTVREELTAQVFKINSINTVYEEYFKKKPVEKDLLGFDVVTLKLNATWPVSLIFNEKVIGCYQMLFRLLLNCKYVERLLCKVWICDQQIKGLPKESRKHYLRAFLLRRKMLLFIQNMSYYMTNEVIEQHWFNFINTIKKCRNIDDVMNHHWEYLNNCMNDCMLTSSKLMKPLTWLLKNCIDFCNFIQDMRIYFMDAEFTSMLSPADELDYTFLTRRTYEDTNKLKKSSNSFEERIKSFESNFNSNLGILLKLVPLSGIAECSNQLLHFLNRQNFNGYYTSLIACPVMESEKKASR